MQQELSLNANLFGRVTCWLQTETSIVIFTQLHIVLNSIPLLFTEAFPLSSSLRSEVDSDSITVRYRPRSTAKHRPARVAILYGQATGL